MSERVPEGWLPKDLGEIAKFSGGSAFKEIYQGISTGSYPFIKVSDMNLLGNERYITKANNWISEEIVNQAKIKFFPLDATVFAKVGAALLLNRRRRLVRDTAIDNNMMAAVPFNCEPDFLYYFLQTIDLANIVQSGAVPSVNQNQMESIPVNTPPLPEQKKIASILTSVDEVIETTQKQIDKLQDLKKATMNELLTKGIGHTEFKDSELGRIPKSWEVKNVDDVIKFTGGAQPPRSSFIFKPKQGYVRLLQIRDYKSDRFASYIPEELSRRHCNEEDVLIGRYGPPIFQILRGKSGSYNVALIKAEPRNISLLNGYMYHFLTRADLFHMIDSLSQRTSGQTGIDLDALKSFGFPLPPLDEQHRILKMLNHMDNSIKSFSLKLAQTQSLKKSLMQDLLTGKVRVQVN